MSCKVIKSTNQKNYLPTDTLWLQKRCCVILFLDLWESCTRCPTNRNVKSPSNEKCAICASVLTSPWQPLRARHPLRKKNANGFSTRGTNYDDYVKIDLHCVPETGEAIFNYSHLLRLAGPLREMAGIWWTRGFPECSGFQEWCLSIQSFNIWRKSRSWRKLSVIILIHLNASLKSFVYAFNKHFCYDLEKQRKAIEINMHSTHT